MPNHLVTAIPVLLALFALLLSGVGYTWGKVWNKKWSLTRSPLRILCVGGIALMAAFPKSMKSSPSRKTFNH